MVTCFVTPKGIFNTNQSSFVYLDAFHCQLTVYIGYYLEIDFYSDDIEIDEFYRHVCGLIKESHLNNAIVDVTEACRAMNIECDVDL